MDLCGPSRKEGTRGEIYFMLVIDDYSRLTWVSFLKEKSEALEKFKAFKALNENQTRKRLLWREIPMALILLEDVLPPHYSQA